MTKLSIIEVTYQTPQNRVSDTSYRNWCTLVEISLYPTFHTNLESISHINNPKWCYALGINYSFAPLDVSYTK
jgi:hypothetical protein